MQTTILLQRTSRSSNAAFAWLTGGMDEQESQREVCRRYLRTYGPVTPKDFGEWFGSRQFKPADARALFDAIANELEVVDVEGHEAFVLIGDTDFPRGLEPVLTVE